ncbi:3-hydroxyacyl-[acyl-carrier-protein] dehydratase [Lachnotalea glycerini]|uniref:3-hydroxyacyl-[acyl-carrier-protein] dehydratase n=1 Tax=Lachnotalea glycerini TaxID=1763509 RepID=A0A318EWE2_9FIRM|nr:3-hydroxyacyl-ACP dehydratase FabZ family protein [Lachnotalea glycerini]OYP01267.1 hypothetical protein CG709_11310 [Lachnotalea glycerini]PXV95567.1 3-hydroxyacyl-[acyl-carrier-protein] dehydratase [Lachnotalea glycerini]
MKNKLTFEQIRKILPQRPPFLLLDKVIDYEVHKSLAGYKNITGTEEFSNVHFGECAIYPGVFLIEIAAQASALLFLLSNEEVDIKEKKNKFGLLGNVSQFQFLNIVTPGDCLEVHVFMVREINQMAITKVEITCEERLVAKGQLSFGVKEYEEIYQ